MNPAEKKYPLYAEVILPFSLQGTFSYGIPSDLADEVLPGKRVCVQFGPRRFYAALVRRISETAPETSKIKEVISVIDPLPLIDESQFLFWEWIASYYLCTVGEVMKAALPASLKMESETHYTIVSGFDTSVLSGEEMTLFSWLSAHNGSTIDNLVKVQGKRSMRILRELLEIGAAQSSELIADRWTPKMEWWVRLTPEYSNEKALSDLLEKLGKAPKQLELLQNFLRIGNYTDSNTEISVRRTELLSLSDVQPAALKALEKKSVFKITQQETSRLSAFNGELSELALLNSFQEKAKEEIQFLFDTKQVVLLHGVTSSGKTEIYLHLIKEVIEKGGQVLYLLPEIALTAQIIRRLQNVFGDEVGIYHSKFSDAERAEVWKRIVAPDGYKVILGVRSSVFLPFRNLQLVIIDEEHENTFKQYDPAPRYHARDASIVLASIYKAKVLLGTATPSVESYYNAKSGKYGLVELFQRHGEISLPRIIVADSRKARLKRTMRSLFTPELADRIEKTLKNGKQTILFQNRRGFAPYIECLACGWIPRCVHCDVSLTLHKHQNQLVCHYCGYSVSVPHKCNACGSPMLETHGFGTEKIEEEIELLFPGARVARMDIDSTRSRRAYESLIADLENHRVDILVGTQMVTKGLDFSRVELVGILDADSMLNFPDFKAHERAFQLMVQVAGRAGRREVQGEVVIQTAQPQHLIIEQVIKTDFKAMFREQLSERHLFHYPPYYRLIRFTLKHKQKEEVIRVATALANRFREVFGPRVLGPDEPVIDRIQTYFLRNILLKIEREASIEQTRKMISAILKEVLEKAQSPSLLVVTDVDPG